MYELDYDRICELDGHMDQIEEDVNKGVCVIVDDMIFFACKNEYCLGPRIIEIMISEDSGCDYREAWLAQVKHYCERELKEMEATVAVESAYANSDEGEDCDEFIAHRRTLRGLRHTLPWLVIRLAATTVPQDPIGEDD